ncbi:YbaY family lipoprotein [Sphingopyxis sp. BSN-002]|uniref:YbaY family lipoprotein n=1 Tax=Sphingopyxis sp. BSN-002 TaxID=2911495 RepID=UPI001EDC23FB|nr:YbaY family lipoprotein [Sphingopyxis sp. BSN-002]UKK83240.1 YbaY family lipoprotein [Sphingopyxis sp. BSN-002]
MLRFATALVMSLSLAGCASTGVPAERTIAVTGSIAYRERIALPPTAQIEVRLDDVSLADAPANNMATQSFASEGKQVPFAFTLTVDRADIDPRHSYAVSARITDAGGKLMFITDTRNSVTFDGRSVIDLGTLMLVKTH